MTGRATEATAGVASPLDGTQRIRGVVFDLDGTLYRQAPLRALMALELATLPLAGPWQARRRYRALAEFRRAQEYLRAAPVNGSIAPTQRKLAAEYASLPIPDVDRLVEEWMMIRPLKYLRWCRSPGIVPLLDFLEQRHVRAGVLSDYPADAKLRALGLAGRLSPVLCSTDSAIGSLKPHPRGFLYASEAWHLSPREVLVVGDRADVDAAGAAAAGMPCVIIGVRSGADATRLGHLVLPSLKRLHRVLKGR